MKTEWRRFIVGLLLLLTAIGFAVWGFSKSTLSNDQRQILLWILPLASGFGTCAFAGSITVKAKGLVPGLDSHCNQRFRGLALVVLLSISKGST
jgi:hypothetical protein